jgi:hypothetical protein
MVEKDTKKISNEKIIQNYKIRVNERSFIELPVPKEILEKGSKIMYTEVIKFVTIFINSQKDLIEYMNGYEVEGINNIVLLKQIQIYLNNKLNDIFKIVYEKYENELGKRWFSLKIQNEMTKPIKSNAPVAQMDEKMDIDNDDDDDL